MSLNACLAFSCLIDKCTVLTTYLPVVSRCLHAFQWRLYTMNPLFNSWFIYRLQCSLKLPSSHSHSSRFLDEVAIYWKCNFSKRAKASLMSSNFPVLRCYHQFIMSPAFNFFSCRLFEFFSCRLSWALFEWKHYLLCLSSLDNMTFTSDQNKRKIWN